VENIYDGRGYTFGIAGFCSGTYDGTRVLKEYERLHPGNALSRFLPAFERIDAGPHRDGITDDVRGLAGFPKAFRSCADDPALRQAERNIADDLYWRPAQEMADDIGAKLPLTRGELYDATINHGEDAVRDMIREVNHTVGGTPKSGSDEKKWLAAFLSARRKILQADPTWAQAVDRVTVYRKLLAEGNVALAVPFSITCYGDAYEIR
jgi:chitosanase